MKRSILARVFISPDEPRLRAGWRIVLQTVLMFAIAAGVLAAIIAFANPAPASDSQSSLKTPLLFLQGLAFTASVYLARRFLDHRSFASLGLHLDRYTLLDLLSGLVITGCIMGLLFVMELALGWLHLQPFAWEQEPLPVLLRETFNSFVGYTFVGWQEELVFRGYWLVNIAEGLSLGWGVLLPALPFALIHLANPNASLAAIPGIVAAAVFLGLAYALTRRLWLSIGLHLGWDFFQGTVFGFAVSGTNHFSLIRQTVDGPEIWTGGAFGPEAGLILVPITIVGVTLVYQYSRLRNLWHGHAGPRTESTLDIVNA